MLASHAVNKVTEEDPDDLRAFGFLASLGGWLTFASAMAMTLIISETTIDYLHLLYGQQPAPWAAGSITAAAGLIIPLDFVVVYRRTRVLHSSLLDAAQPTLLTLRSIKGGDHQHAHPGYGRFMAGDEVLPEHPRTG